MFPTSSVSDSEDISRQVVCCLVAQWGQTVVIVSASFLIQWQEMKERERNVESRRGYSFCQCCMMFNMPLRMLCRGEKCCRAEELRRKSCLHPIFHFFLFSFFICIHASSFLSFLCLLNIYSISFFHSPHSVTFPSFAFFNFFPACECVTECMCWPRGVVHVFFR